MYKIATWTVLWAAGCTAASHKTPEPSVPNTPEPAANSAPQADEAAPEPTAPLEGSVVTLETAPTFVAGSGKASITRLAQGEGAFVGMLELDPGVAVPEHQDATDEYIYVLSGSGTITMAGTSYEVGAQALIYMPAGITATYQNGDTKMVALQIFAGPAPAAKYDSWAPAEDAATP